MDYSNIIEILEDSRAEIINGYLENGWVLLGMAPGRYEDGMAYIMYSIGRPCPEEKPPEYFL